MDLKSGKNRLKFIFISSLIVGVCALVMPHSAVAFLTVKANHDHITVDFFYHGSTVSVSGHSDKGADIIIKITSPEGHQVLKKKGKVGGVLWMNVGTLAFEKTPDLYFIHSTKKIEDILEDEEIERHSIGYLALMKRIVITPVEDEAEKKLIFDEFVKFKEHQRLYAESFGNIHIVPSPPDRQTYSIVLPWPYQAPPGEYELTVYAVKGRHIVDTAQSRVKVEQVGGVKLLSDMATKNAAVYGTISIIAALAAGFGVGIIFRKGGGSH